MGVESGRRRLDWVERARIPVTPLWTVYGLLTSLLVGYLVYLLGGNHGYSTAVDGWGVAAFELAASALCLTRGLLRWPGRAMALVLGAGILSWSLGDVTLTVESLGGANPPSPSVADAFYLGFYPLTYVAVVLLMRGGVRRLATPSWLDGAVAGLGAAAICAAFAFHSIVHSAGGSALSVATNLAYPVGDLLLLALVAGATTVLSGRRKAPWLMLATGCGLNVVGDTFNLFQSSVGSSHLGTVVNGIAWPTAILLMSASVWLRPRPADPLATQRPTGFVLPGLAAAAGLVILFLGTFAHPGRIAIALGTTTLLVVGVRLALSVRGLRTLTFERYRQSVTDELTGLGNRRRLFSVLDSFFAEQSDPRMPSRTLAFLFIDLDHFKEINDSFGHPAGDQLLRQLGPRLVDSLRSTDLLFRLGGDEFAVVLVDADAAHASTVAQRMATALDEPFDLDVVRARIGASIGIALAPRDATDSAGLLWCADVAMYRAKSGRTTFALYDHDLDDAGDRLRLVEDLRVAIAEGLFVLHYQPQLDLRSGQISAVEALVRWPHPRLGMLPPLKFLPLAEEAGLMGTLTRSILWKALEQCAAWRADGRPLAVSVNISATNLLEPGFVDIVRDLLEQHGLPADALILEITETTVITEFDRSRLVLEELRALGLEVSIDDFGAGYTSLAYLSSLPVRELKLDRAFVTGLATGERARDLELVRATIELGHALGLRIVAEGIEDSATLQLLSDLGCDVAQGYFIGKPRAADELAFRARPLPSAVAN
jgi:diguanylate cyclase (GGDEF)-like protein